MILFHFWGYHDVTRSGPIKRKRYVEVIDVVMVTLLTFVVLALLTTRAEQDAPDAVVAVMNDTEEQTMLLGLAVVAAVIALAMTCWGPRRWFPAPFKLGATGGRVMQDRAFAAAMIMAMFGTYDGVRFDKMKLDPLGFDPSAFLLGHGARFSTEIYTRACHWFPRLLRLKLLQTCDQWHSSRVSTFLTS
jgi:hypothetical protein